MSKKLTNTLLVLIIFLGGVLRLSYLNRLPTGFTPDEAAFGYNAYSLLLTGNDEWGTPAYKLFTQNLRSFGDYKLPLYSFITVPFIKIIGLNETATRMPNAIFGIFAIISIYFLSRQLFNQKSLSLLTAFMVAISPWNISLSRGAFESNLVTFFLPLAVYFYLKKSYLLSAFIFAVNIYSYHSARLVTPFVILALVIFYRPKISKLLVFSAFLLFILSLPALKSYIGVGQGRLSDLSIFNPTDNWSGVSDRRFQDSQAGLPDKLSRAFNNKVTSALSETTKNYLSYLSPQFLFTQGAGEATYGLIPGRGLFYYVELPFLLAAIVWTIKKPTRKTLLLLVLILISIIPATLAKGLGFSANRAAPMFPFVIIFMAYGAFQLKQKLQPFFSSTFLIIFIIYVIHFTFFAEDYIYHAPRLNAPSMSYGWSEAINRFKPISSQYSEIKVSRSFSESHIFIAFYWPVPPTSYQRDSQNWANFNQKGIRFLDQYDGYRLGNFRFGDLNPNQSVYVPTMLIGKPNEFTEKFPYYFQIYSPTGQPAIQVSAKQP